MFTKCVFIATVYVLFSNKHDDNDDDDDDELNFRAFLPSSPPGVKTSCTVCCRQNFPAQFTKYFTIYRTIILSLS